jgi:GTPase SAR1 family protein
VFLCFYLSFISTYNFIELLFNSSTFTIPCQNTFLGNKVTTFRRGEALHENKLFKHMNSITVVQETLQELLAQGQGSNCIDYEISTRTVSLRLDVEEVFKEIQLGVWEEQTNDTSLSR